LKQTEVTRENIEVFVVKFYEAIMEDKEVGPFFIDILGDDINNSKWQEHIEILIEFWCAMILKEGDYYGSPFSPHADMSGLKRITFVRWLEILDVVLADIYEPAPAKQIREVGEIICNNFMQRLGL
jgi:hemoglobin